MDIILLGIYSFFVWLIFFKCKWLPWNITSQLIVVTIPAFILTMMFSSPLSSREEYAPAKKQ